MDAVITISIMSDSKTKKTMKYAMDIPESVEPLIKDDPKTLAKFLLNKVLEKKLK